MTETDRGLFESASIPDAYRRLLQPVIFAPWALRLVEFTGLRTGQIVIDVASGTGAVARAAARAVGAEGKVIASDISAAMLAKVPIDADPDGAPIETLESSATELALPDDSVDAVLCQQGFPFIPDRTAAAREMHRVLRPGGTVGIAVWAAGRRLEPFDSYGEALIAAGIDAPFIRASASGKMSMSENEVREALRRGGFSEVEVTVQDLTLEWPSVDAAVAGISGTPYWKAVEPLGDDRRREIMTALRKALTGDDGSPIRHSTVAVLGRGVATA